MATGALHLVEQVGVFTPNRSRARAFGGRVGFMTGIKELKEAKVGDTVTADNPAVERCPDSRRSSRRSAGPYPVESNQYESLRDALRNCS
jgi:GTP-binding protein LepA